MKIFISHSSQDKELALMIVDYLTRNVRFDIDDIFCTSLDNALIVGEDFINRIKNTLSDADIVLFIITENYISSKFCIMEMGAAWAFKDNIVPIIVPPLDFNILQDTPMKIVQGILLNDKDALFSNFYANMLVGKKIIPRLSFMQEHELLNATEAFTQSVTKYANAHYGFNFSDAHAISVAQNGDIDATEFKYENDIYSVYCNFKSNEYYPIPSNFISFVFQFSPHKNWSNISPESIFSFECRTIDDSIASIILELKSGYNLFKFYDKRLKITSEFQKYEIPLNYKEMPKNNLTAVSEVCFVVRPNFVPGLTGNFEIRNVQYCDSKINI